MTRWWERANTLAQVPEAGGIAELRGAVLPMADFPDVAEAQTEMLDALDAALALSTRATLPMVETQHRVIGPDRCHYIAPASLADQLDGGGRLFVTSDRLILVAGGVKTWGWHQIARLDRRDRDVLITLKGRDPLHLRLNAYEHAILVTAMAGRLLANRP